MVQIMEHVLRGPYYVKQQITTRNQDKEPI